jgi:hypothetical protein
MKPAIVLKTLKLGLLASRYTDKTPKGITDEETHAETLTYRTYSSSRNAAPVIILHGLTRQGFNDHRLVSFAGALAKVGYQIFILDISEGGKNNLSHP